MAGLASALSLFFLSRRQCFTLPAAFVSLFPAVAIVIAIMVAEVVPRLAVFTTHMLFPLTSEPRLALQPNVPFAFFAQVAFMFALANITAKVLSAVVLARMVIRRRCDGH